MNPILAALIVPAGCFFGSGLFVAAVAWNSSRRNRRAPAPSKPQREPYSDKYAAEARFWPVNDFEQAGLDRLRAEVEAARTEATDPTSPARLRHIPAPRKEQP